MTLWRIKALRGADANEYPTDIASKRPGSLDIAIRHVADLLAQDESAFRAEVEREPSKSFMPKPYDYFAVLPACNLKAGVVDRQGVPGSVARLSSDLRGHVAACDSELSCRLLDRRGIVSAVDAVDDNGGAIGRVLKHGVLL
jgi:hypothetical protein